MIDSFCSLTPGVETEEGPPVFLGGTAHLPRSACSPVSLRSTGGFFMAWKKPRPSTKEYDRKYREDHLEQIREKDRLRWLEKKSQGKTKRNGEEKALDRLHHKTRNQIVLRKACEICGVPAVHRHHPDYSKPFEVMHLCSSCHMQIHANERKSK